MLYNFRIPIFSLSFNDSYRIRFISIAIIITYIRIQMLSLKYSIFSYLGINHKFSEVYPIFLVDICIYFY